MLPTKFWAEMSWRDFAATDMSKVVAVLPVAAVEQHGPHLPVGVDMFINEGYFARAVQRIPDDMPVLILPIQAIGKSNEHIEYPGTLTLSMETNRPPCRTRARASLKPIRQSQVDHRAVPSNWSRCTKAETYACCMTSSMSEASRSTERTTR